ncbi:hypothetical protein SUGI_0997750 [Cryptomeria japonica]|nr:hypothetical protein SUGI_0997750 [Cryptomeria japonica]
MPRQMLYSDGRSIHKIHIIFMDIEVSNLNNTLQLRSCAFFRDYGMEVFAILPLLIKKRINLEDNGTMGIKYGSKHLSVGTTFTPIPCIL